MAEIPYNQMDFVFISSHYDIHLSGLCRVNGKLHRFETPYDYDSILICNIYELGFLEKTLWLYLKWKFELLVGTQWTYPLVNHVDYQPRKPRWFWKIMSHIYYKRFRGII